MKKWAPVVLAQTSGKEQSSIRDAIRSEIDTENALTNEELAEIEKQANKEAGLDTTGETLESAAVRNSTAANASVAVVQQPMDQNPFDAQFESNLQQLNMDPLEYQKQYIDQKQRE